MTQEARELVERLRAYGGKDERDYRHLAATTITTLLDKLAAAERERDEARKALDESALNTRLQAALKLVETSATALEKVREAAAFEYITIHARAQAAEARDDKLAAALEPFAALADDYLADTVNFDDDTIMAGRITRRGEERTPPRVTFADFRRARSALAEGVANG